GCEDAARSDAAAAPIRVRLEAERLFAERTNQRLVARRDDDDARFGHGVTATVFFEVVADERAARDEHVAIDYRPADARVAPDSYAGHQNALLDVRKAVNSDVRTQHAAVDAAA